MKIKKVLSCILMLVITLGFFTGCRIEKIEEENNNSNNNNQASQTEEDSVLGTFAKYGDNIYYWKLDENSREAAALYGLLAYESDCNNILIRRDKDGKEHIVTQDSGYGKMYVTKDKIYFQELKNNVSKVCSIDHNGTNKKEYGLGTIEYVVGNYIYIQSDIDILALNIAQDSINRVVGNADIIGIADEYVYYMIQTDNNVGNTNELKFGNIHEANDKGIICNVKSDELESTGSLSSLEDMAFTGFKFKDGTVFINVGTIQGTGHYVYDVYTLQMNADGTNYTKGKAEEKSENSLTTDIITENDLVEYNDKELLYKNTVNSEQVTIMTDDELYSTLSFIGTSKDSEYLVSVCEYDVIGSDIYFIIDNGKHNKEDDIGWRYSYRRTKTAAVKYNLNDKTIDVLYTF